MLQLFLKHIIQQINAMFSNRWSFRPMPWTVLLLFTTTYVTWNLKRYRNLTEPAKRMNSHRVCKQFRAHPTHFGCSYEEWPIHLNGSQDQQLISQQQVLMPTYVTYLRLKASVAIANWLQFGVQGTARFGNDCRHHLLTATTGKVAPREQHLSTVILNVWWIQKLWKL